MSAHRTYWIEAPMKSPRFFPENPLLSLPPPPVGVTKVPVSRQHLTLCYLGGVTEESAQKAFALALGITGREGFRIRAKSAAFLGEAKEVLVIRVDPALRKEMRKVRTAVRPYATEALDRWPPNPHITVAHIDQKLLASKSEQRAVGEYARIVSASVCEVPLWLGPFRLASAPVLR